MLIVFRMFKILIFWDKTKRNIKDKDRMKSKYRNKYLSLEMSLNLLEQFGAKAMEILLKDINTNVQILSIL